MTKLYRKNGLARVDAVSRRIGAGRRYRLVEGRTRIVDVVVELVRGAPERTVRGRALGIARNGNLTGSDLLILATADGLVAMPLAIIVSVDEAPAGAYLAAEHRLEEPTS